MGNYKDLRVWQEGLNLCLSIYQITKDGDISKDYGLRDQLRRSAISIPSNIAEGDELNTNKQSIRHFYIAKGSCAELQTQLTIAEQVGYLNHTNYTQLNDHCDKIRAMLNNLVKARSK